jgi:hypothetical protein
MAWLSNDVLPAGASPWCGSKEARAPAMVLESGMPATVFTTPREEGGSMTAVMIGIDPHKGSHTAVAISGAEEPLGELRVRASAAQAGRLLATVGVRAVNLGGFRAASDDDDIEAKGFSRRLAGPGQSR